MKTTKKIILCIMAIVLFLPFFANAENEEEKKDPVTIYMFRGEGCGYCKTAMEWFESIKEEYGDYFELKTYEVWYDEENAKLMEQVVDYFQDTVNGVPYIIVGDKTYSGFAEETMADEIKKLIKEQYESEERFDVMKKLQEKPDYSNIVAVVSVVIIVGLVAMVIIARKQN